MREQKVEESFLNPHKSFSFRKVFGSKPSAQKVSVFLCLGALLVFPHCAGDYRFIPSPTQPTSTSDTTSTNNAMGVKVTFHYSNTYSITEPNPNTGCAGDMRVYYEPFLTPGQTATFPLSTSDASATLRPAFIKNVSVDLTDTGSDLTDIIANQCSLTHLPGQSGISSCATFDYGAIGGIPTSLGGTVFLLGGRQSTNYSEHTAQCGIIGSAAGTRYENLCSPSAVALGIDILKNTGSSVTQLAQPGELTQPASQWNNLNTDSEYAGPSGLAGAAGAYLPSTNQLIVFGGSAPLSSFPGNSTTTSSKLNPGAATQTTWTFNFANQIWKNSADADGFVANDLLRTYDCAPPNTATPSVCSSSINQLSKTSFGRALFGYVALPGMGLDGLGTGSWSALPVDTTDRIVTVGGLGPCLNGVCNDVHKFNPTYGPEYFDTVGATPIPVIFPSPSPIPVPTPPLPYTTPTTLTPTEWIDSYPGQVLSNNSSFKSQYTPIDPLPTPTASPAPIMQGFPSLAGQTVGYTPSSVINFGMTYVTRIDSDSKPTGYLIGGGGFYGDSSPSTLSDINTVGTDGCDTNFKCGGMKIALRHQEPPVSISDYLGVTNFADALGLLATPFRWTYLMTDKKDDPTPWYGGVSFLPGLNLSKNDVVYFGGSNCKNYLTSANVSCPGWPLSTDADIRKSALYLRFGADPSTSYSSVMASTSTTTYDLTIRGNIVMGPDTATPPIPTHAGMAAARGADPSNNPIIVAWGGMRTMATTADDKDIYYLSLKGTIPTWTKVQVTSSTRPRPVGNASLTYSHVTHKFYLFGGYNPSGGSTDEVWELSFNSNSQSCAASSSGTPCEFVWRSLNSGEGLSCYPDCPTARRSHRMIEVNYNHINPGSEPICTVDAPCSFGIFMEGGTSNGVNTLADRWMFDPTANSGNGHWQKMGELPPRVLSGLATVEFSTRTGGRIVHRAVLFGGETGMQNPVLASHNLSPEYFVPPTLGDTWIYDFDLQTWNRVSLYGQRFNDTQVTNNLAQIQSNQILDRSGNKDRAHTATPLIYSPPPLSGSIMVTRTHAKASEHSASETPIALPIPEVFLFGGRTKDGKYSTLDKVYKFCAGSTGEKPYPNTLLGNVSTNNSGGVDDAFCDAYDSGTNPQSQSPKSDYSGRWLLKNPSTTPLDTSAATFLGAGAYDSRHDLIVFFGGLKPNGVSNAVTNTAARTVGSEVWEYTPPSKAATTASSAAKNGAWNKISNCVENVSLPAGRYGHSLVYDPTKGTLILIGGYNLNGELLQQTQTTLDGSQTFTTPEVWTGFRVDDSESNAGACYHWEQKLKVHNPSSASSKTDAPTAPLANAIGVYIPSSGYNSGYYSTFDNACIKAGPIVSSDDSVNKLLAGGVYFDIDRTQLGKDENLILNLTLLSLGNGVFGPNKVLMTTNDNTLFKVHLMRTGQSAESLLTVNQPRHQSYSDPDQFPKLVQSLSVLSPSPGQSQQEQIIIPLRADPSIDRIRIERYSGSAILIDASLFRLGHK